MSADHDLDEGPEIQWCAAPGCVRPVTYHPAGMHLTEDGREFSDAKPTPRARLQLVESRSPMDTNQQTAGPWHPARAQGGHQ